MYLYFLYLCSLKSCLTLNVITILSIKFGGIFYVRKEMVTDMLFTKLNLSVIVLLMARSGFVYALV